jgi:hypothetical protein
MKHPVVRVVIGVCVAVMALSCAEQSSVRKPASPEATVTSSGEIESATEFAGTIGKIDAEKGLIWVEHWPLSKMFRVPPECVIDIPTNVKTGLAQLKVQDAVVVTYSETGNEFVANRIVRQGKAFTKERDEKLERLDEMLNPSPNQ